MLHQSSASLLQTHDADSSTQQELIASLQYAPDPGPFTLRKALSSFLSSFYAPFTSSIPISHIVTTGGASQSLGVALTVVADPKYTRAWVLEPTYFLAAGIFGDTGMRVEGVDGTGSRAGEWDLGLLRERLDSSDAEVNVKVSFAACFDYQRLPFDKPIPLATTQCDILFPILQRHFSHIFSDDPS
jgi:DNA-binding transcriptional MocR family regulator